jgi:DNA-binding NtrC family response regulator
MPFEVVDGGNTPKPRVPELVGRSSVFLDAVEIVEAAADSDAPVLFTGESGTGKDVLARLLHVLGPRRERPMIALDCAALPENLVESELFGHERGAFTGALERRIGRFRAAHGSTLLLDEIDALTPTTQAKLLRVLDGGEVTPLGSDASFAIDARIVCTSNRSLHALAAAGRFRSDLLYRIDVVAIAVPPLRERDGDLPLLVEHFLARHRPGAMLTDRAMAALRGYRFPGNVRELEHAIRRAVVMSRGTVIDVQHLPVAMHPQPPSPPKLGPLLPALREFERAYLRRALAATGGNRTRAAALLGISRKSLWERLKSLENVHEPDPAAKDPPRRG